MNTRKNLVLFRLLILLVYFFVFSQTSFVFAQPPKSIVPTPSEGSSGIEIAKFYASWCTVFQTLTNIFNFMLYFGIAVAVIIMVWGGIMMVISQGNPGNIKKAQETITVAIQGVFITLIAWIIVNTILGFLGAPAFFSSWNNLRCTP